MRNGELRFTRLACAGLVLAVLWQPLTAATLLTWGCVLVLAGLAASQRVLGRLA